ncbi:MAG: hypothetical protein IPK39_05835 [Sulfuritalea sp.]|nr:hypothetical protein [Sulfuritalea sp.]
MSLSTTHAPLRLTSSNTFRYFFTGDFDAGEVTVAFLANQVASVAVDTADVVDTADSVGNLASRERFTVVVLTAALADPATGSNADADLLNNRGYFDVDFLDLGIPGASAFDVGSITDLAPEFNVSTLPGNGSIEPDNTQTPVRLDETGYKFRYWYTGTFKSGTLTLTFIDGAFSTLNAASAATPVTGVAAKTVTVEVGKNSTWIDVSYGTVGGVALDAASITDTVAEFTLSGAGLGTATLLPDAPTRLSSSNDGIDNNGNGIVDEADENVYRYYVSRGFGQDVGGNVKEGSVAIEFSGASWTDKVGNLGKDSSQAFQVINVPKADDGQSGQSVGKVFFIEISGGIKLQGLGFTEEPIIDIRGGVTLEIGDFKLTNGSVIKRFTLDANGTIKIIKLGNIGSAAARFVLQAGDTVSGKPEFWGVAKIQANLDFLKNYGIFAEGNAMLQINTTSTPKTEKIALEGIPGDVIKANINLSVSGLSNAVLGEVDLPSTWTTELANAVSGLDGDPALAGVQAVSLVGAKVQTIIRGQEWKIITKKADGKFGPSYFLRAGSTAGTFDLQAEGQTFELPAESFSIQIVGSLKIKKDGSSDEHADDVVRLFGGFYLRITPERFEIFVQAEAEIPVLGLNGKAVGLIIIDGATAPPGLPGIAMMLNLQLTFGASPDGASGSDQASALDGIFELRGSVVVTMNTTLREQVFQIPRSFLDLLPDDAPSTVTVFAAAPEINGTKRVNAAPEIYISANIQGSITLFDTITLTGFISFTAATDANLNAYVRIAGAVSVNIQYLGALTGSLDLLFFTNLDGQGPGIIGRVQLALADGGAIPGVTINGQFLLEVNSYSQAKTITSFQTNKEHNASYSGTQPNILATDPDTGFFIFGDITINPGIRLVLQGMLKLGSVVEISGRFEFSLSQNPFSIDIKAQATMKLFGIGEFSIDGVLRVDGDGLAAYINVSIGGGFGGDIGLSFQAGATLELYIGSLQQKILTKADGTQVTVKAGFRLNINGTVTFLGFASASGSITITLQRDVFSIEFDISLALGPLTVAARGGAAIYTDSHPGLALLLDVSIEANMFEIIKIKASGKLQLNTSSTARTLSGITMQGNSFLIALNGEVSFLEVLKFNASFVLAVGYEGVGSWRVQFAANMDFFGLVTVRATGMFNYKGYFDISLDGELVLGTRSFGLVANLHFRVAFGERPVASPPGVAGLTEYFFLVEFSGGASLRAFGITFAGVDIGASITASGEGRVPLVMEAEASVKILFIRIRVSMSFTLGYIELPKKVYLAGNPTGDVRPWDPVSANGVLYLNMGERNAQRGIAEGVGNELYTIEHMGSDASGETLRVVFSGRETIFKGVKKLVAYGGEGDDHIYVKEGVTADVDFHGGNGNDVFIYDGTGQAWLYGDAGDDYLATGDNSTSANLFGGAGMDYIVHNGSGRAVIDGGADGDKIYGGAGNDLIRGGSGDDDIDGRGGIDQIYGDAGNDLIHWDYANSALDTVDGGDDNDILEIVGTSGVDDFRITSFGKINGADSNRFKVANFKAGVAAGSITGTKFEDLRLDARAGADKISLDYMAGSGLGFIALSAGKNVVRTGTEFVNDPESGQPIEQPKLTVSDDRAADTVTILGHDGDDDIVTLAENTEKGIAGIGVSFGAGLAKIVVSDSVRGEGDTLVIDTRKGNDSVDAHALTIDRAALRIVGGDGNDTLKGSRFNDVIDSGLGSDTVTGDLGLDEFLDASVAASDVDTLVEDLSARPETFGADVGLYNDKLVIGNLLNSAGTAQFEVGRSAANELTDAGDRFAASATLENLNGIFEVAEIKGGGGNNTIVVSDLDRSIRVGDTKVTVLNWRGTAILDNAANDGPNPEHYLVTVPTESAGVVHIRSTGADSSDRLVVTGSDFADRFLLATANGATANAIETSHAPKSLVRLNNVTDFGGLVGAILTREFRNSQKLLSDAMAITHQGVDNVETDTRGGDDRIAVQALHARTTLNTGGGSDSIYVGSKATLGDLGKPDTNTGGTLNDINALLSVNGQGSNDQDLLDLDDTGDGAINYGTLTATNLVNGVTTSALHAHDLMGANGAIAYGTLEFLNIHLGSATTGGNVFTIASTHGDGSATTLTSLGGADVINVETVAGPTRIDTGAGNDIVRVGSSTGGIDPEAGVLDAFSSSVNAIVGNLEIDSGEGQSDTLKVYDSGDNTPEAAVMTSDKLTGMGLTLGIGYHGFEVLKVWLSNNDNSVYIDSTHAGVTFIDLGDETPVVNGTNDVVNINSISGPTTIDAGQGNDVIRVNFDRNGRQTFVSGINGVLTLHGQEGSDLYEIGLAGQISSRINVFDQSRGDPGTNRLRIYGTEQADFFLLRANKDVGIGMVAAIEVDANRVPVAGGVIERINYDGDISGAIEIFGRGGDDTFVLDDNLAPTTIFGDAGSDTFQVGQVYQSFRDGRNPDNGLAEEDYFQTTQITRGFLSNGVSQSTVLNGGVGNDNFTVLATRRSCSCSATRTMTASRCAPSSRLTRKIPKRRTPTSTAVRAQTSSRTRSMRRCASTAATASTR